jgi:hypothetical protein
VFPASTGEKVICSLEKRVFLYVVLGLPLYRPLNIIHVTAVMAKIFISKRHKNVGGNSGAPTRMFAQYDAAPE